MPYEDFPPLQERTASAPNAAGLAAAQAAGQWAETFGKGDTNFMLRKRHNQDIEHETAMMQQAQEAQQNNQLQTSKTALDYHVKSTKLNMDMQLGKARLDEIARKADAAEQLLPLEIEAKKATTTRILAQTRAAANVTKLKEEAATQVSMDNDAFADNMRASGARPGSQEYVNEMVKNRGNYPGSNGLFNAMFRAHSGSDEDPEEFFKARRAAQAEAGPNSTVTTKLPGGVTITDRPTLAADRTLAATQLGRAQARRDRASKAADEEGTKQANEDIELWSGKLAEADAAHKGSAVQDPRKALAQKALADPNASEAHKAAARRLLGQ